MHVIVHRILRGLSGCLEQWSHIHVKADVGKGRGNHLRPPVVAILAHLHHQHPGAPPLVLGKLLHRFLDRGKAFVTFIRRAIYACEGFHFCPVAAKLFFHCHANLSHSGPGAGRFNGPFEQISAFLRTPRQLSQRRRTGRLIPACADLTQPRHLRVAHRHVVHIQNVDLFLMIPAVFVHAHDHLIAPVNHRLTACRRFLDAKFWHA